MAHQKMNGLADNVGSGPEKGRTNRVPLTFCLGCGYVLSYIERNRCPECGRAFDPGDPLTYATEKNLHGLKYLAVALAGAGAMVVAIAVTIIRQQVTTALVSGAELLRNIGGVLFVVAYVVEIGVVMARGIELVLKPWEVARRQRSVGLAVAISVVVIVASPLVLLGLFQWRWQ